MVFTILYFIPVIGQLYHVFTLVFFNGVGGDGMPMTMSVMWTGMQQKRNLKNILNFLALNY